MPQIYDTGPQGLPPFRRKSQSEFLLSEKNPLARAGFEPANLGCSGEHDNNGTTGVDTRKRRRYIIRIWALVIIKWEIKITETISKA